ncbi:NAD(P)/FAD-dependent oxidoreductase [Stappia sp. F7233]|uniref:NADH:ubiquinone reductase (non-electrogenic) n=1 Tax=Stappia albiluteola TaxID=2758565 RepID=A0A839AE58_9HYPH|nr:NAD(P)/FAD-dependent oxidoreductase [Stappia albiluteola]MBA5777097.1 NAD(P)/FAD-dependent oxidoreductase [Stappia albiluteola]
MYHAPHSSTRPADRPSIVIVGAGFGGLAAARALKQANAQLTLIDRRNYHLFQPLLYQVATAALSPADIAWPVRALLSRQKNVRVAMGRVTGVDSVLRHVQLDDGRHIPYDYLVLATGARHAYFGRDDWSAHAPGLKKIDDATEIRRRVLTAFERAEQAECEELRAALMTFVVVGAGPTGVEMAGAIAELARRTLASDFRSIDPRKTRVLLVEAGGRVLPSFNERLSTKARGALERLGVEVRLGKPLTDCGDGFVAIGEERLAARTVIWAAGVMASPAAKWLGVEADRAGRIMVAPDLSVAGLSGVYAVGDTVIVTGADGRPVPGVAPAAKQMGRHVGRLIARRISGRGHTDEPFRYRDAGSMATIGRGAAVAEIHGLRLAGYPAWLLWAVAHVYFLIGARSRLAVAANWLWNYFTFERGARLITGSAKPMRLVSGAKEQVESEKITPR